MPGPPRSPSGKARPAKQGVPGGGRQGAGRPGGRSGAADRSGTNNRRLARNRRARHEYDILETFECGISLHGGEVKSLRGGQASLQDSYARVDGGEIWLYGMTIAPYVYATGFGAFDPSRRRKLLLHRRQIDEIAGRVRQQSLTLVPLAVYLKEGRVKVELAVAKGRRLYDKRHAIAERDANRESERAMKDVSRRL